MIVYVDTSAAAKLLREEDESAALASQLDTWTQDGAMVVSSLLLETELRRMAVRSSFSQELVTDLLERFGLLEPDRSLYRQAGVLGGPNLRSLDALHIAAAIRLNADLFVTYDERQREAALQAGFRVVAPKS